jgi:hypothetical protein
MVAAVIAGTTVGTVTTAQAAESTLSVKAGRLVLEPGERGYRGLLPVTITYQGDDAVSVNVNVIEPVTGSFVGIQPSDACVYGPSADPADNGRRDVSCGAGELQPGETRRVNLEFQVLTTPRDYAMKAADTPIEASLAVLDSPVRATATSRTLFRSTTGSIAKPQPYVQDTRSDLSVTAADATLTRQPDGSYAYRVPVTVRFAGDVPHFEAFAQFALPAGATVVGTDPEAMCGDGCYVPGGQFMQGESRTFDVLLNADVAPGETATGSVTVSATWYSEVVDVDPSDNTAEFTLSVA